MPNIVGNMGWNITQIISSSIKNEAQSKFKHPTPFLASTIRPKKFEKFRYGVVTNADYWAYVEHGRKSGKPPPITARIILWAKAEDKNPYAVAKAIGKYGTKPTHYVKNGFAKAQPKVDNYIDQEMTRRLSK